MPKKKEPSLLDLFTQAERDVEGEERDLPRLSRPLKKRLAPPASQAPAMRLDSLEIKNLWCYEQAEIAFDDGITVIAGPNGSGKSSLLESIFFALYGSKAGPAMDRSLADILRLGAEAGSVQLKFRYGSNQYTAQMALRCRGDSVVSEREDCRLLRDDGTEWVGVENAASAVEELFGMNRDDFTNCLYVRQGEIDRLIRAGEEERRRMIDRLLRLEKLDRYAQRAREGARRALNRRFDGLSHRYQDLKRAIEVLQAENLDKRRLEIEEKIQEKQSELKNLEKKISEAERLQHGLRERLQRLEELTREVEERQRELSQKEKQLKQHETREQQLGAELEALKQRYKQLETQLGKGLTQLNLPKEQITRSFNDAGRWEEIEVLPQELSQTKSRQEALYIQIQERQTQITQQLEKLATERESLLKNIVQAEAQEQNLRRELEEMCSLAQQGRCPLCQQPVRAETFRPTLKEKEMAIQKLALEIKTGRARLEALEAQIHTLKQEGERSIQKLDDEFKALEARRHKLEELKEQALRLLQIKEQGLEKRSGRKSIVEDMEALRDEIARLKAKIAELEQRLGDAPQLQERSQQVQEILQQLLAQKGERERERESLLSERGRIEEQLEQLKRFQQAQAETEEELKKIEQLQAELEQLREFYETIKKDLRKRNIRAIELYFNQLFGLMDSGASYRGVRITEDYEIFVELKNGSTIRPELLSGGERALINIALRSAIHQVLSQAASRMPLILDEPTIYLDRDRVNRLQFLLEELGRRIGQVIVVSHEVGLVEGADHEYRTEKTADNTSRVYRVR